jgi:hypothetical protein
VIEESQEARRRSGPGVQRDRLSGAAGGGNARVFTACQGTQLMVVQHLRRHLPAPDCRDFLLWHPYENIPFIDRFMAAVISDAGFADTLDIREFESLRKRTHSAFAWLIESPRRLRSDSYAVQQWMQRNQLLNDQIELWADDPIHFNVNFSRGYFRAARHVRIPHCFDQENVLNIAYGAAMERQGSDALSSSRRAFLAWQRCASGVDLRPERVACDRAYTFDRPFPAVKRNLDVSHLISLKAFTETYNTLPTAIREQVASALQPIVASRKPLVLLLLFGLGRDPELRGLYERAVDRIFSEHARELTGCSLAVKVHPSSSGAQERAFIERLRMSLPVELHVIDHGLNLEFMLPQLRPDYVVAGVCGGLPVVRRLRVGRPVVLSEFIDLCLRQHPVEKRDVLAYLADVEIW